MSSLRLALKLLSIRKCFLYKDSEILCLSLNSLIHFQLSLESLSNYRKANSSLYFFLKVKSYHFTGAYALLCSEDHLEIDLQEDAWDHQIESEQTWNLFPKNYHIVDIKGLILISEFYLIKLIIEIQKQMDQNVSQQTLKDKAQELKNKINLTVETTYPNELKFVRILLINQMINELNAQVKKLKIQEEILDYIKKQNDNLQSNLDNQYLIIKQQYKNYILIANDIYTQTVNQVKQQNCCQFAYFNNIIDQVMKSAQSQYYQKIEYLPSESQFKTHCKSVLDQILKQDLQLDTYNKEAQKAINYAIKKYDALNKSFNNKYNQTTCQQIKENLFKRLYYGFQQGMNEPQIDDLLNVKNVEYQILWGKEVEMLKVKELVQANYPNDFEFIRIQLISRILKDIEIELSGNASLPQKQQYIKKQLTDLQQTVDSQYKQIKEYFKKHLDIATEMYEFHQQSVLKQKPLAFVYYKNIVEQQLIKTKREYQLRIQLIVIEGGQFKKHCEQIFNQSFYGPIQGQYLINFETFNKYTQNACDYVNQKLNILKAESNENSSINWEEEEKQIFGKLFQLWQQGMDDSQIDELIDFNRIEQLSTQKQQDQNNKKIPEQDKVYVKQKVEAMQQRIIKEYKEHEVRFLNWEQIKNQVFSKFCDGWKPKMEEYECDELLQLKNLGQEIHIEIKVHQIANAFIELASQKGQFYLFDEEYLMINQKVKEIKEIQKSSSTSNQLSQKFYEEIFNSFVPDQQIVGLKMAIIVGIIASNLIPTELTQNSYYKGKVIHLCFNYIRESAQTANGNCSFQQFKNRFTQDQDLVNQLLGYLTKEPEQIKSLTQSIQKEYCEALDQILIYFKNKIPSEEEYKQVVDEQEPLFLQIVHPSNNGLDDDQEEYLEKQIDKFQKTIYFDWLTKFWNQRKQDLKNYQEIQEEQLTQKLTTFQDQIAQSIQNKLQYLSQGGTLVDQFKTRWSNDKWEEKVYSYFGKLLQGQQQGMDDSEINELIELNRYQQLIQERKQIQETLKMQKTKVQDFVEATYTKDYQFIKQLLIQKINKDMEQLPDFLNLLENNIQHTVQEYYQLIVQQYKSQIDCAQEIFNFNQNKIKQQPCYEFFWYQIVKQRLEWSYNQYVLQLQFTQEPDQFKSQCQELFYKLLNQPIEGQQTINLQEFNEKVKSALDYVTTTFNQMPQKNGEKSGDNTNREQMKNTAFKTLYQGWKPQMNQIQFEELLQLKRQIQEIDLETKLNQTTNTSIEQTGQNKNFQLFNEKHPMLDQIRQKFKNIIISEAEYKQVVNEQDPSFLQIVHPSNSNGLDDDQKEYLEKQIEEFQKTKYQGWLTECWNLCKEEITKYQEIKEDSLTEELKQLINQIEDSIKGNKLILPNQGETLEQQFKAKWIQDKWYEKVCQFYVNLYEE